MPYLTTERDGMLWIDWTAAVVLLLSIGRRGFEPDAWAYAAHVAIAEAAVAMAAYGQRRTHLGDIVLSGGVFMNRILTDLLVSRLKGLGVRVLLHRQTPPNDGCIALGQAIVAGRQAEPAWRCLA